MFNGPRAMINFNDAMGGGHNVTGNGIWNTCRESGDHGPVNSWNRMAFASRVATGGGEATYAAALSEVHLNYVNAGYGGSQAFGACEAPPPQPVCTAALSHPPTFLCQTMTMALRFTIRITMFSGILMVSRLTMAGTTRL